MRRTIPARNKHNEHNDSNRKHHQKHVRQPSLMLAARVHFKPTHTNYVLGWCMGWCLARATTVCVVVLATKRMIEAHSHEMRFVLVCGLVSVYCSAAAAVAACLVFSRGASMLLALLRVPVYLMENPIGMYPQPFWLYIKISSSDSCQ